jgi:hypothetical protein
MKYQNIGLPSNAPIQLSISVDTNLKTALEALPGVSITGTVTIAAGSKILAGTGTDFDGELKEGDFILVGTERLKIVDIGSNTLATLESAAVAVHTAVTPTKSFDFNRFNYNAVEFSPQDKIRYTVDGSTPSTTKGLPAEQDSLRLIRGESITNVNFCPDSTATTPVLIDIHIGRDTA